MDFYSAPSRKDFTMAFVLLQFRVKDYGEWRKVFDSSRNLQKSYGWISSQVYHGASDPNEVTLLNEWDTLENAQRFAASSELKEAQIKAGVLGVPAVSFLSKA
jgi:heme-degrading monooxygenase HmoA